MSEEKDIKELCKRIESELGDHSLYIAKELRVTKHAEVFIHGELVPMLKCLEINGFREKVEVTIEKRLLSRLRAVEDSL